jgi:hypothetical protein
MTGNNEKNLTAGKIGSRRGEGTEGEEKGEEEGEEDKRGEERENEKKRKT